MIFFLNWHAFPAFTFCIFSCMYDNFLKLTYLYAKVCLEMKILLQNCKLNLSNSFHSRTLDTSILLWDQNLYEVVHTCLFLCTRQYYIKGTYFPTVMQVFYYQVIYLISGDLKQILPDRYNFSSTSLRKKIYSENK